MSQVILSIFIIIGLIVIHILGWWLWPNIDHYYQRLRLFYIILFSNYCIFLGLALFIGQVKLISISILVLATFVFFISLFILRWYKQAKLSSYTLGQEPLLIIYFLEIIAFVLVLPFQPFILFMMIVITGILCGWYIDVKNLQKILPLEKLEKLILHKQTKNIFYLFFPRDTRLIDNQFFSYDTYAAYVWVATFIASMILLKYGISLSLMIPMYFAIWFGSLLLDRFTIQGTNFPPGYAFFGGLMGASLVIIIYHAIFQIPLLPTLNIFAVALSVGHAIGRLGCIAHGCCSGKLATQDHHFIISYLDPLHKINRICATPFSFCYPSIICEEILQILIAILCLSWPQYAVMIWFSGYGILRILLESYRFLASSVITFYLISATLIFIGISLAIFAPITPISPSSQLTLSKIFISFIMSFILSALFGARLKSVNHHLYSRKS